MNHRHDLPSWTCATLSGISVANLTMNLPGPPCTRSADIRSGRIDCIPIPHSAHITVRSLLFWPRSSLCFPWLCFLSFVLYLLSRCFLALFIVSFLASFCRIFCFLSPSIVPPSHWQCLLSLMYLLPMCICLLRVPAV